MFALKLSIDSTMFIFCGLIYQHRSANYAALFGHNAQCCGSGSELYSVNYQCSLWVLNSPLLQNLSKSPNVSVRGARN